MSGDKLRGAGFYYDGNKTAGGDFSTYQIPPSEEPEPAVEEEPEGEPGK